MPLDVTHAADSDAASSVATAVTFGSAHLFSPGMSADAARGLLHAAAAAGITRFDTAPLYGWGRSEPLVAEVVRHHPDILVTTKVGLEPARPPSLARSTASRALRLLPLQAAGALKSLLRGDTAAAQVDAASGRFELAAVRASIERSLARLGHIDRLLLHEVHALDVTDHLLDLLAAYRQRGDVATFGVASGNDRVAGALRRAPSLFTVAHFSVDPLGAPAPALAEWPDLLRVGHGALGAEARTLTRVRSVIAHDADLRRRWQAAAPQLRTDSGDGLAAALLAHSGRAVNEVIVATRRPERIRDIVIAASGQHVLADDARKVVQQALTQASP